jgi:hypothetical protein
MSTAAFARVTTKVADTRARRLVAAQEHGNGDG